ncbi:MAG: hypothetical protein O4965_13915 [Trichodesmium sp. St19_bin1]|nr:hypothetical protein [Trichodesmium sp. St19_bin1]
MKKKRVIKNQNGDITGNVLGDKSNIKGKVKTNPVKPKKENKLKRIISTSFNILKEFI